MDNKQIKLANNSEMTTSSERGLFYELMTEEELISFLRIPEVSTSKDYHNVIKNLIRYRDLPRIKICHKLLFPKEAVLEWINKETVKNGP